MTVINPNSISGITSITLPAGADNVLTIHTNDGVERFRIDSTGNIKVGTAATISPDGDLFVTGVCTATTLSGAASGLTGALPAISGANLTNLPAANLTGALPAISGANLTGIAATDNVRTGILDVSGISTFRNTMNVGAAVTISESGIEATGVGITVANINGGQVGGRRNIVINGKALINQRGDSTGNTSSGYYGPDRFETTIYGGTYSHSAASSGSTLPEFPKCFRIDCTSAASAPSGTNEIKIKYHMEGQDVQHLQYGTSSAKTTTLSFYVRSNKTETSTVWFYRPDGSRMNAVNFSISAANTWEKKVITIVGDTTSAIADDNTMGYKIEWVLAAGPSYTSGSALNGTWGALNNANRYVGNTGTFGQSTDDYFDLTGVQYEVGSQATEFEHRSFGDELRLCHRYFHSVINQGWSTAGYNGSYLALGVYLGGSKMSGYWYHPVPMRANPTLVQGTATNGWNMYRADGGDNFNSLGGIITNSAALHGKEFTLTEVQSNVSSTGGYAGVISVVSDDAWVQFDSEL